MGETGKFFPKGAIMQIGNSYSTGNIWDIMAPDSDKKYSRVQQQATPSGDTVDISDDAKKLYSEMIHKYDHISGSSSQEDAQENGENGGGQAMGGSGSDSSSTVESVKKQIESLKSQLTALTAQMGGYGDAGAMSKIQALEAQIASLEAQLNEMAA